MKKLFILSIAFFHGFILGSAYKNDEKQRLDISSFSGPSIAVKLYTCSILQKFKDAIKSSEALSDHEKRISQQAIDVLKCSGNEDRLSVEESHVVNSFNLSDEERAEIFLTIKFLQNVAYPGPGMQATGDYPAMDASYLILDLLNGIKPGQNSSYRAQCFANSVPCKASL